MNVSIVPEVGFAEADGSVANTLDKINKESMAEREALARVRPRECCIGAPTSRDQLSRLRLNVALF